MSWRFHFLEVPSFVWVDRDVPLVGASVTEALSAPASISGTVPLSYDQRSKIKEWGTILVAEQEGRPPVVGIVDAISTDGDDLKVEAGGFSMYPQGQPWTTLPFSSTSVDPLDVFRKVWAHLQSQPAGDLGVVVDADKSSVRLGVPESSARTKAKSGVAAATTAVNTATAANTAAAKSLATAKTSLLAAGGRPSNGLVLYQDSAPSGDKRSKLNLWIDKNDANKGYVWNGKKWVLQTTSTQATINTRLTAWVNAGATVTATKKTVTTTKAALTAAKSKLSDVDGGEAEPFELNWWDTHDLGSVCDDLAKNTPFEYREVAAWVGDDLSLRVELGVPVLGVRRADLRFEIGINVTVAPPVIERDYASEVTVLGAGEGRAMRRGIATGNPGRLRRAVVISRKDLRKNELAASVARNELPSRAAAWTFDTLTVIDHQLASYGSFRPGDQVLVVGDAGWVQLNHWVRITELTTNCTSGAIDLRVEVT